MRILKAIAPFLLIGLCVGLIAFDKQPIPRFPGDGNPQHDGQPLFCRNFDTKEEAKNCSCRAMSEQECAEPTDEEGGEGGESAKCKVYCRKNSCQCERHCDT
jgi:hypothetical protein